MYSIREDTEEIFGAKNIKDWADLNNVEDTHRVDDRIDNAIEEAKEYIDGRLKGCRYAIPFDEDKVDPIIKRLSARYTGVILYDSRKLVDIPETDEVMYHRLKVEHQIKMIHAGQLALVTLEPKAVDFMQAIEDEAPRSSGRAFTL